jgi:hypothetical protein
MPAINFLWDPRPGSNIDHIAAHGLTTQQWESVFHNADRREEDKDEPSFVVAEGRLKKRLFRIVYELDGDVVVPILHHSNHGLSHHTSRPRKEKTMKTDLSKMTVSEYQNLAKRLERRFGPDKAWADLPLARRRGRPAKGQKSEALKVHSIKMTDTQWTTLQTEAQAQGTSVNTLIRSILDPSTLPQVLKTTKLLRT